MAAHVPGEGHLVGVIDAPGLPGRLAPKAAGELIKEAVYAMMEEA